ncbi:MAG: hypothetical protein ACREMM_02220 [Gemmatimonadales bacterium]
MTDGGPAVWRTGGQRVAVIAAFLSASLPVRLPALQCPDGSPPPCRIRQTAPRVAPAERTPSLSVLYLENVSPDTGDAALADGITEELIIRLSQIDGLRVTSRYGALRYRGRHPLDPRHVGRELGVRYVLQGTLRRAGERVRVSIEITDAVRGHNVWAATFDRAQRDVFALQDAIAVQVAEAVRGRLTGQERARLASAPTTDAEAYQAYLRGRAVIRDRTARAAALALAEYRRATSRDSGFALGYAGLAHVYALAATWGWDLPAVPPDSLDIMAIRAASRALLLDSSSAESWLAATMAERAVSPQRSLEYNRRAVALDSTNIEALHQLAWAFYGVDELDSAIDPFYAYPYAGLVRFLDAAGRPLEALAWAAQGLAIDSSHAPLHDYLADVNLHLGRARNARLAAERALSLGASPTRMRLKVALAQLSEGDTAAGRTEVEAVAHLLRPKLAHARGGLSYYEAGDLGGAYAQLGESDSAIAWIRRISPSQRRFHGPLLFTRHWLWQPLQADARFQALLAETRP